MTNPGAGRVDPAFAALLADPRLALRRPPPHLPLAELRAGADAFMARARGPAVAAVADLMIGGVPVRLYRPSDGPVLPLVLFAHGGGFVLGGLASHDAMTRALAVGSGAAIAAVDYRLAPEAPFPAALNDLVAALAALRRDAGPLGLDPDRIALAGDSAGGQLVAALAVAEVVRGATLRHLALLYPLLDPARASASARAFAADYMLTGSFVDWAWEAYGASPGSAQDPLFDLSLADLAGLPPATVITAEFDPLRDEGEAFARRLAAAGVPVALRRFPGTIHGFAGLPHVSPAAGEALSFIAEQLHAALR